MNRIKEIWSTTLDELINKVTWPSWDELVQSTVVVLIASIIFALVIYVIDLGFDNVTRLLYNLF
ncbi:MAG: preprotein translocase subunit SecE [Flavobacteriales bacterium]|nr:preprotein translocase subunit SecE [Flavobacteriales bacterium]